MLSNYSVQKYAVPHISYETHIMYEQAPISVADSNALATPGIFKLRRIIRVRNELSFPALHAYMSSAPAKSANILAII